MIIGIVYFQYVTLIFIKQAKATFTGEKTSFNEKMRCHATQ
jgi:hypothetical protein